ncbi:MAG: hypothetical protein HY015_09005 [Bacteroidetes bacterium]|nr:hypothetical protein [Bacteroidota bacterium]MBI3483093.1 hypothetical protein [Bacteroidota bacterium]
MKIQKRTIFIPPLIVLIALSMLCCTPKEQVIFKGVKNIVVDLGSDGKPVLKGDVYFFNPNKLKMKLKDVDVVVLVDGAKSAEVKQHLNLPIPAQSDFSVPITATLTLKEGGLLNTVFGLLGGKKYEVVFTGYIRIGVHRISIKVPVSQKQEIKLR